MKTQEELNALKQDVETVNNKLRNLNDEELKSVNGGIKIFLTKECPYCGKEIILLMYNQHISRCKNIVSE